MTTEPLVRARGDLSSLDAETTRLLMDRAGVQDASLRERTASIIADVRRDGDTALRRMARQFDGVTLDALEVPRDDCQRALDALDTSLRRALERAARNIETVHRAFMPAAVEVSSEPGIVIGRRPDPLARVGVYAPGGSAAYPSSLLMGVIPARVAGVREVVVCSPPQRGGCPSSVVLAAAALTRVDRVFAIGGAGAIAAMAYGTESVPPVDRIVGPGNAYVAEAKLQVVGRVAIDAPAGPSELLVLADDRANADAVAGEMMAQAEHDPQAAVVAVVHGDNREAWLASLDVALRAALAVAPRADIARRALSTRGALLSAGSEDAAIAFANEWAAEHVLLAIGDDQQGRVLARLRGAGTVFVGASSSVAFGDYMTGANHVLPTAGLARCYSGLSTLDFMRWTTWQRVTADAAAGLADDVACIANAEGLPAHAVAALGWSRGAAGLRRVGTTDAPAEVPATFTRGDTR